MENVEITPTVCSLLKKNPNQLKQLIDSVVEVTCVDNKKIVGRIYTIDPVSNSLVLFKAEGTVEVVIGHAVKHIELASSDISVPRMNIFPSKKGSVDEKASEITRSRLKTWLQENRIPIEEDGNVLIVNKALSIYPPYGCDQCICANSVMLDKVQRLISVMPKDKISLPD